MILSGRMRHDPSPGGNNIISRYRGRAKTRVRSLVVAEDHMVRSRSSFNLGTSSIEILHVLNRKILFNLLEGDSKFYIEIYM